MYRENNTLIQFIFCVSYSINILDRFCLNFSLKVADLNTLANLWGVNP